MPYEPLEMEIIGFNAADVITESADALCGWETDIDYISFSAP